MSPLVELYSFLAPTEALCIINNLSGTTNCLRAKKNNNKKQITFDLDEPGQTLDRLLVDITDSLQSIP